jgi:hypothetical protein
MVRNLDTPARDPWAAPWATPEAYEQYLGVGVPEQPTPADDDDVLDGDPDEPRPEQRFTRAMREAAIFEATGTAVVIDDSPGGDDRRATDDETAYNAPGAPEDEPAPVHTTVSVGLPPTPARVDERKVKRNARDRAKRLKAWRERMRSGAKQNGPKPRGR